MPDLHYDDPALAELYDIDNGWSADRDFYIALAGPAPQHVLDLGCGTGLMASRYATLGHPTIEAALARAGLQVDALHGDWHHGAFDPERSEEMVFIVSQRP